MLSSIVPPSALNFPWYPHHSNQRFPRTIFPTSPPPMWLELTHWWWASCHSNRRQSLWLSNEKMGYEGNNGCLARMGVLWRAVIELKIDLRLSVSLIIRFFNSKTTPPPPPTEIVLSLSHLCSSLISTPAFQRWISTRACLCTGHSDVKVNNNTHPWKSVAIRKIRHCNPNMTRLVNTVVSCYFTEGHFQMTCSPHICHSFCLCLNALLKACTGY